MNKTWIYALILVLLGFATWRLLKKEPARFDDPNAAFTVKDTAAIGRIFLARPSGDIIKLEKRPEGWILNDSFKARKGSLSQLLYVLYKQEAMAPAPKSIHNDLIKYFATNAIKVELYKSDGTPIKTFYVGGEVANTDGSYMMMAGAESPYVVQIPNHNGYLGPFYEPIFVNWRDRGLVAVSSDNLKEVVLEYFDQPQNSFHYKKDGEKYTVQLPPSQVPTSPLNTKRARVYSTFFDYVNAEVYVNGAPALDSMIAHTLKRARLSVTDIQGRTNAMDIYWKPVDRRSKNIDNIVAGIPEGYDADRMYAVINNARDTVIIQSNTFDKILRRGEEFYIPETQGSGDFLHRVSPEAAKR